MIFRYARHTDNLEPLIEFYTKVIGLEVLGRFTNHSNYNGVFLGYSGMDWHIEFTESNERVNHYPDVDDLLVFYLNTSEHLNAIKKDANHVGAVLRKSKNPYWQSKGLEILDPDGFGVILTIRDKVLDGEDDLTKLLKNKGVKTWDEALRFVKEIPYGRNSNRIDFKLVLSENKGTCSSKHALLKQIASLNSVNNVKLIMGIYKMSEANTIGIGNYLSANGLAYIPEAHCYLKLHGKRIDITNQKSDIRKIEGDIIEEFEIEPAQVGSYKIDLHKKYLKNWRIERASSMTFEDIWAIREKCILELSKNSID